MKIVDVPFDVTLKFMTPQGEKEEVVSFKKFLVHQLDTFDAIKTKEQIRQADKIVKVIEASNGTIQFEDADHAVLLDATNEPRYASIVKRQLLPFVKAIETVQELPAK